MKLKKPRLAVDMDEVIADANSMHASWLTNTFGYEWLPEVIAGTSLSSLALPEHNAAWEEQLHLGKIFGAFDVMPDSQDALARLSEDFDVFITTAAMEFPASCAPKYAWLQQHFPFISPMNVVFCGDKSIIAADFLIDDNVRHFARFKGQGVLFNAPHNVTVDWPFRIANWAEATQRLRDWARST